MYPTFVDLCGLPKTPHTLGGEFIAKTLAEPTAAKDRTVLLPHMFPGDYALINCDWRYIHYADGDELYDVQADPNEWTNVANDPKFAEVKSRIAKLAPKAFAKPAAKLNAKNNLILEGETLHLEVK